MQPKIVRYAPALLALLAPGAALAHHSGAMFDNARTITVSGTVREFRWANPHAQIELVVGQPGGASSNYAVELSSMNIIARKGWDRHSLSTGDRVVLTVHPMRDGSAQGILLSAKLPTGKTLTDHDY